MNIIFLGGFTYPNGMAGTKRVTSIIHFLKSQRHNVKVLILHNDKENIKNFGIEGIHKEIPFLTIGAHIDYNFKLPFQYFALLLKSYNYLRLNRKLNKKNILYVYNSLNYENIVLVLFAKLFRYKIVTDIVEDYGLHEEDVSKKSKIRIKSNLFFEKRISKFVDAAIVISFTLQNKFLQIVKSKIPVFLLPACVNFESTPVIIEKDVQKTVKFLYAGSFGNKDGVKLLVDAFNATSKVYKNCELLLAGKSNNNIEELLLDENGKIKYCGYISDDKFRSFINTADVLCMTRVKSPYANAGFPFKLVEYLSTGKPVIAAKVSDVEKYLEDKKDAFLYEADNYNDLKRTIEFVIENQTFATKVGLKGFETASKYFNVEFEGNKLINFLEELYQN